MILRLSEQLDVPLRERNALLLAGGYAPAYPEHSLDEPEMTRLRVALRQILTGHEPYPALVVNRWWEMLDGNAAVAVLTDGCDPALLTPPVNALRVSLHPDGMASRIANLPEWRAHILERLHRQVQATRDPRLAELLAELSSYPGGEAERPELTDVAVPLRLRHDGERVGVLQHDRGRRRAAGCDGRRSGDRVVLSRRRGYRRGAARNERLNT